ncbi:unnamed protein product [Trifolium pratense]|uniref:Uncharacterized protein n=1 Tax=Trifolium pratense TaxID=57577 RepID=A0ACB0KHP3_TRIPR|nr:unnamed protein product [Trifolium pratense]
MELRRCDNLHYIKIIKGGLVTNVLNVFRGRPKLKFRNISDIHEHESFSSDNDDVEAVRSCVDVMEEGIVKTEPDVWVSDADDGDVQRIHNLDDDEDDCFMLTLMQIKESCKSRKRKRSQGLGSSKIKIEDSSTPEDYMEKQKMEEDDPDFMETLTSLRTKLSKNMKTKKKKKCVKDHPMSSQEIVPVDQSKEMLDSQELSPSSGDSAALVEVKFECPDNDCFDGPDDCPGSESKEDHPMSSQQNLLVDESEEILDGQEFSPSSEDSAALVEVNFDCHENYCFDGPGDCSSRESKDHPMSSLEIVSVDESEEILDGQEFSSSTGDSAALVQVNFECHENDCFDGPGDCSSRESKEDNPVSSLEIVSVDESEEILDGQEFAPSSGDSPALVEVNFECPESDCFDGPGDCSSRESKEDQPVSSFEIASVDESEEILDGQEFAPSSGDSAALVEVNFECPESDCFDRSSDFSGRESKEDAKITLEWNSQHEINYKWKDFFYHMPLRVVSPSGMDIIINNSELSSDQSTNFPAMDFEDNSDIFDNQLDDDDADIPVSLSEVASRKDFDIAELEFRSDDTLLEDCSKEEYTADAEVQDKPCSTIEHMLNPDRSLVCCSDDSPEYKQKQSFDSVCDDIGTVVSPPKVASHEDLDCAGLEFRADNTLLDDHSKDESTDSVEIQHKLCPTTEQGLMPDGCPVRRSDDSPEYEEKQSFVSLYDGENIHVNEAADDLTSCDEHEGSPKLHGPERLLSTRKAISPSSQEKLCKAMESVDISHKNSLKRKGALQFTEQTDENSDAEGLNDITRPQVINSPKKIRVIPPKPSKSSSNLKGVSKIRSSSRSATHMGCSTLQNCSKSAIAFSKQQMNDAECLAMKLTKELKSMKDIVDDMLRSEFCLNTSLRYKVNEARMAVKSATKAEEGAKRWLSYMSRDCNRFCKVMKLAESSTPQDVVSPPKVVRREKKIAFADEAGGRLCQVRFYEEDEGHLSESK